MSPDRDTKHCIPCARQNGLYDIHDIHTSNNGYLCYFARRQFVSISLRAVYNALVEPNWLKAPQSGPSAQTTANKE